MFTGIIEAVGVVAHSEDIAGDRRLRFEAPGFFAGVGLGDSIAVSGVCLTAVELGADFFVADLSGETLQATTARHWGPGIRVNLERALTPSKPLGGHMVSGHVDGVGTLIGKKSEARSWRMDFELPPELARYVARKGSVCIDGVSLTVNDVGGARFGVNIIPHTLGQTTLGALREGDAVNIEVDLVARYLERLVEGRTT